MENCVISRTVFNVDDKSEIRFKLSSILLEKIDIEKSGNLMMGQLCGSIVADVVCMYVFFVRRIRRLIVQ